MKNRKGVVATVLMLGTLLIIGVVSVVSSLNLNSKHSTSSRASASTHISCGGYDSTSITPASITCGAGCPAGTTYAGSSTLYSDRRECCCKSTGGSGGGGNTTTCPYSTQGLCLAQHYTDSAGCINTGCTSPTYKYVATGGGGTTCTYSTLMACNKDCDSPSKCTSEGCSSGYKCVAGTPAPSDTPPPSGGSNCGSGSAWACPTDYWSAQKCKTPSLEFGCCVRDTIGCDKSVADNHRVRWYGCTGQPCGNTKISNTGSGGIGELEACPVNYQEGKCTSGSDLNPSPTKPPAAETPPWAGCVKKGENSSYVTCSMVLPRSTQVDDSGITWCCPPKDDGGGTTKLDCNSTNGSGTNCNQNCNPVHSNANEVYTWRCGDAAPTDTACSKGIENNCTNFCGAGNGGDNTKSYFEWTTNSQYPYGEGTSTNCTKKTKDEINKDCGCANGTNGDSMNCSNSSGKRYKCGVDYTCTSGTQSTNDKAYYSDYAVVNGTSFNWCGEDGKRVSDAGSGASSLYGYCGCIGKSQLTTTVTVKNNCAGSITINSFVFNTFAGFPSFYFNPPSRNTISAGKSESYGWTGEYAWGGVSKAAWMKYSVNGTEYQKTVNVTPNGTSSTTIDGAECHLSTQNSNNEVRNADYEDLATTYINCTQATNGVADMCAQNKIPVLVNGTSSIFCCDL
jgi:hypothetical protein